MGSFIYTICLIEGVKVIYESPLSKKDVKKIKYIRY